MLKLHSVAPLLILTPNKERTQIELGRREHPHVILRQINCSDLLVPKCHRELTYQKLIAFRMEEYGRLIWLDLDVSLVENIDHLFELPMEDGPVIYGHSRAIVAHRYHRGCP